MNDQLARQVYAAFGEAPLHIDQSYLYVDLDKERGDADVVRRLLRRITFAGPNPTCQVLAGHKGSGKSTELFRLKHKLDNPEARYFTVYCSIDEDLDRNDVDFPDLLLAIVRQMSRQLKEREGISLKPGYFVDRFRQLQELLFREIDIEKLDLDTGIGTLAVAIKGSPDSRQRIRKALEPDTGNLLNAANDLIGQAIPQLVKKGFMGLVILVDDLDKMVVRPHERSEDSLSTADYLFINRAAQLTGFMCHVVYTIPISLAYSHREADLKANYGDAVPVVPMTKLVTQPPEAKPNEEGIAKFSEIIEKRLKHVGTTLENVFQGKEILRELILLSGGQPSELMSLVRESIIAHDLPIDDLALNRARKEGERDYARQLRTEHWPLLEEVRKTGLLQRTEGNEKLFRELLESRAILQYVNDIEWYGLNPMVASLKAPQPPARPKAE